MIKRANLLKCFCTILQLVTLVSSLLVNKCYCVIFLLKRLFFFFSFCSLTSQEVNVDISSPLIAGMVSVMKNSCLVTHPAVMLQHCCVSSHLIIFGGYFFFLLACSCPSESFCSDSLVLQTLDQTEPQLLLLLDIQASLRNTNGIKLSPYEDGHFFELRQKRNLNP